MRTRASMVAAGVILVACGGTIGQPESSGSGGTAAPLPRTTAILTIATVGSGRGQVMSTPAGIKCPGTCTMSVNNGSVVSLTADPEAGSTFVGWGGACSGVSMCTLTLSTAAQVTATFDSGAEMATLAA